MLKNKGNKGNLKMLKKDISRQLTLAFSILTKFDIKFLENAWDFIAGS